MKKKYALVISDVEMNVVTDAPWESVEKIVGILDRKMRDIHLKSYRCTKNQAALLCALEYCSEKLELQDRNAELEEIAEQDALTIAQKDARIAELEAELAKLQGENEIMHGILERAAASTKRFMGHQEAAPAIKAEPKVEQAEAAVAAEPVQEAAPEAVAGSAAEAAEPVADVAQPTAKVEEMTEEVEAAPVAEVAEAAEAAEAVEPAAQEAAQPVQETAQESTPEADVPAQLSVDFSQEEPQPEVNTKAAQVIEEIAQSQTEVPRVKAKVKKSNNRSRVGSMFDLLTFNDV